MKINGFFRGISLLLLPAFVAAPKGYCLPDQPCVLMQAQQCDQKAEATPPCHQSEPKPDTKNCCPAIFCDNGPSAAADTISIITVSDNGSTPFVVAAYPLSYVPPVLTFRGPRGSLDGPSPGHSPSLHNNGPPHASV